MKLPHRAGAATFTVALVAGAISAFPALALGPRDRHLTSTRQGVSVEAPAGWTLSQHSGYGDTVAVLLHPDGGRISVTAAPTTAADARALFEQNKKGLLAQKLVPAAPQAGPRGFLSVDITTPERSDRLRQLYFVRAVPRGRQAVILTLVCRDNLFAELTTALAFVAERLELDEPLLPPSPGDNALKPNDTSLPTKATAAETEAAPPPRELANEPLHTEVISVGGAAGTTPAPKRDGAGGSGGQLRPGHRKRKPGTQYFQ
ncbi:MAG TPA: hypothetical protein VGP07_16575 [Polyangia bacterium]|jgi:hypothetical protein